MVTIAKAKALKIAAGNVSKALTAPPKMFVIDRVKEFKVPPLSYKFITLYVTDILSYTHDF